MNYTFCVVLLILGVGTCLAQSDNKKRMVAMAETYQKPYKLGSVYYETGSDKPFTGFLYGTYDNGKLMTKQEYVNGVGNGLWVDYDPLGNKVCEGTYKDNKIEGPVKYFYETGELKSEGQFLHWKRPIGKWVYYDKQGNIVHQMTYTR